MSDKYYFYSCETNFLTKAKYDIDKDYKFEIWRPCLSQIVPKGSALMPFAAWWFMHYTHAFKNRDYSMFLIYEHLRLISRIVVHPDYFRFPFMAKNDLFISDTFTEPTHRGKNLVTFAMQYYLLNDTQIGRKYWGIASDDNFSSLRTLEKAGFKRIAEGRRIKRFGLNILGKYEASFY